MCWSFTRLFVQERVAGRSGMEMNMTHVLIVLAENIFVVIGFALYGVLMYYIFTMILRKHFRKKKTRGGNDSISRKNFSKHVIANNHAAGNDFSRIKS